MTDYKNAQHERKASGTIICDGVDIANTMQCCHCGKHFVSIKGSGKLRGYCRKCMQITCGDLDCCTCTPYEQKLEEYEKGKRLVLK